MSWILSWWSKTTHLSVRSSFLPDLNLTRDNDVQEKVFTRLGLGSMLSPYSRKHSRSAPSRIFPSNQGPDPPQVSQAQPSHAIHDP